MLPGAGLLCGGCDAELRALEIEPCCALCAAPVGPGGACPRCQGKGLRPFARIVRLGRYDDPLRELIHHVKYHRRWPLAELLADRLLAREDVKGLLSETGRLDGALLAVPLHRWRRIARGYNQAELIARRLGSRCGIPCLRPVVRWRWTGTQIHQHSRARRVRNLRDAFVLLDERAIRGRHLVLIDDVMTTGATLRSLARVLMPARPASLSAIVLAIADPARRHFQVA
jgi:ComF family protein